MRQFFGAAVIGILITLVAVPAGAQSSVKDLAAKASAELRLLTAFQTLERMTSQMNHFLIYAITSERGGWGVLEFVDTTDYGTNAYVIRSTAEDVEIEVARAKNAISKSKVATTDEMKALTSLSEQLDVLVGLAPQVADMVTAGTLDEASVLYHEVGQPAYENALRNAQSAVGTVQKRLGKTLIGIRVAK